MDRFSMLAKQEMEYQEARRQLIAQRAAERNTTVERYEMWLRNAWLETRAWHCTLVATGWTQNDTPITFLKRLNQR